MHMQGTPRTMQQAPHYARCNQGCGAFLAAAHRSLRTGKVSIPRRIAVDPGFGFGKTDRA